MRIPVVFLFTGEHKALQIREQRGGAAWVFPALSLGWLLYILALPKLGAFSSNIFFLRNVQFHGVSLGSSSSSKETSKGALTSNY